MRTGLSQKQLQLQKLSPQQIQLMKLLQVPTALLEQRIKEELEENPALEENEISSEQETGESEREEERESEDSEQEEETVIDDDMGVSDYIQEYLDNEDDTPDYRLQSDPYASEEERTIPTAGENTLHDFLEQQVGLASFSGERELAIARQLIGSIDEDGYLRRDMVALVDDLMFSQNLQVSVAEIEEVLRKIQRFDPPGIGARDLQECLLIQLGLLLEQAGPGQSSRDSILLAHRMLERYFDAFSKKHYDKLLRSLDISEKQLKGAVREVLKLNPKPSSGYIGDFKSNQQQYIIPDFILLNKDNGLELVLHSRNMPELRISDHFREMLKSYGANREKTTHSEKEAVRFIRQKIESARWFIDAIQQRHDTMYRTMFAILEYQYDYFLSGDQKKIRPMILQDISQATGLDVSTISRVASSKYVQTEFGTRRLKDFFSESMQMSDGEEVSTLEVKKILSELVAGEDKRQPLSDDKLTQVLGEKGYPIARRTVAKYRDQMNIAKASLRREL